ncbi:hypothetical protein TNIN_111001 [Trichonephila inaurata madagascariensis]|uniref:Uncharacterized protein n=1 Tax=Trichonephila inaurata madagascariensis TaxID=2747483 RepID=A0A8X6XBR6_9ARAC|nr:hypothetical protein TNIN_111001 [Trichonephila inaurata madagascariensis]
MTRPDFASHSILQAPTPSIHQGVYCVASGCYRGGILWRVGGADGAPLEIALERTMVERELLFRWINSDHSLEKRGFFSRCSDFQDSVSCFAYACFRTR